MRTALAFILTLVSLSTAQAKVFSNSYISFQLPDRWNCVVEKTVWTCRDGDAKTQKEAVIMLTAKEEGAGDSLSQYEAYLKTTKQIAGPNGSPMTSQIKQVKQVQINGQPWVDGMHLSSEVPYYYTRYLATVKHRIAILVTFSAHQRFYTRYSQDFFKAIQSLKVIASPSLLSQSGTGAGGAMLGTAVGVPMEFGEEAPGEPTGSSDSKQNALLLAVLLAAIGGYFFIKKKKKKIHNPFGN